MDSHARWAEDIRETQGQAVNFPIIADPDRKVAGQYGMVHPAHDEIFTVRTGFVIDPKKIRLMIIYPQTTGRNFDEILSVVDSLQLTDAHRVATPVNWKQGDDVIIVLAVTDAEAKEKFPKGWRAPKPLSAPHAPAGAGRREGRARLTVAPGRPLRRSVARGRGSAGSPPRPGS